MLCRRRVGSFAQLPLISEPLLALHRVILRELGDDGGVAAHLAETASPAREAGSTAEGLRSVYQSAARARRRRPVCARQPRGRRRRRRRRGRLGGGGGGGGAGTGEEDDPDGWGLHPMSSPLARWRLEEAELLWASHSSHMAMGLGKHLMAARSRRGRRNPRSGSATPSGRRARSSERATRRSSPPSSTSGVVAKAKVQRRRGTFHSFDFFGDACRLVGGILHPAGAAQRGPEAQRRRRQGVPDSVGVQEAHAVAAQPRPRHHRQPPGGSHGGGLYKLSPVRPTA